MSKLDDPIDAVESQYPEEPGGPISIMLDVLAPLHPFAGVVNAFSRFISRGEQMARVKALFEAVEWYIRRHEKENLGT